MKYLKMLALASATALAVLGITGTASATIATSPAGTQIGVGTVIKSELVGTAVLHPPIGNIECTQSNGEGKVTRAGSGTETPAGEAFFVAFSGCNAEVVVLSKGTGEIHTEGSTANGNGTMTSTGAEVTVTFSGFHCIFKTNGTDVGVLTGGTPAVAEINGVIPRTGGRSGAFCGSTAQLTATAKVTTPGTVLID